MPRCGVPVRQDGTSVANNHSYSRRLTLRSATGQRSALSLPPASVNDIITKISLKNKSSENRLHFRNFPKIFVHDHGKLSAELKLFQFRPGQFNQRPDRRRIELKLAARSREQFRQRTRAAQREGFFVIAQRLHLVRL